MGLFTKNLGKAYTDTKLVVDEPNLIEINNAHTLLTLLDTINGHGLVRRIVRFGDEYKQWNAAFDAGYAAALGKSLIIMHGADHQHALKEVDACALAVVETPQEIVEILRYVLDGKLA